MHTLEFKLEFAASDAVSSRETLIYLPASVYGLGEVDLQTSDGSAVYNVAVRVVVYFFFLGLMATHCVA